MNGNWSRNAFVYLLIIVAAAALFINIYQPGEGPEEISLSRLASALQRGNVESVTINGNEARVVLKENGATVLVRPESDMPITETLTGMGVAPDQLAAVTIKYEAPGNAANWLSLR
jgi:cell division protease FtsH